MDGILCLASFRLPIFSYFDRQIPVRYPSKSSQIASLASSALPIERRLVMNIHAFTSFLIAPLRPQCELGKRRYAILLSWILPLFIGSLLVSQLCLLWTPRLVLAEEPETITVTERKDYPDGLRIPQWNGSNGAFLYCGDELNKRGANYGDTLTVMNPRDYHGLRTADGLHNGSYSEYQLKALDYILYHGAGGIGRNLPYMAFLLIGKLVK